MAVPMTGGHPPPCGGDAAASMHIDGVRTSRVVSAGAGLTGLEEPFGNSTSTVAQLKLVAWALFRSTR